MRDKNRQVADDPDSLRGGMSMQALPLLEKHILHEPVKPDFRRQLHSRPPQRFRVALRGPRLPLCPCRPRMMLFQGHEQGIFIKPTFGVVAEFVI